MAGEGNVPEPLDSTVWVAVAVVGAVVFFLGIWMPAFSSVPHSYRTYIQGGVAVLGGALFVLGLSYWYDASHGEKIGAGAPPARVSKVSLGPSFEVYDPRLAKDAEAPSQDRSSPRPPNR